MIIHFASRELYSWLIMNYVYHSFFAVLWGIFTIAFGFFGFRLIKLMPTGVAKKVKIVSN